MDLTLAIYRDCSWDVEAAGEALLGDLAGEGGEGGGGSSDADSSNNLHGSHTNSETSTAPSGGRRQSYV